MMRQLVSIIIFANRDNMSNEDNVNFVKLVDVFQHGNHLLKCRCLSVKFLESCYWNPADYLTISLCSLTLFDLTSHSITYRSDTIDYYRLKRTVQLKLCHLSAWCIPVFIIVKLDVSI